MRKFCLICGLCFLFQSCSSSSGGSLLASSDQIQRYPHGVLLDCAVSCDSCAGSCFNSPNPEASTLQSEEFKHAKVGIPAQRSMLADLIKPFIRIVIRANHNNVDPLSLQHLHLSMHQLSMSRKLLSPAPSWSLSPLGSSAYSPAPLPSLRKIFIVPSPAPLLSQSLVPSASIIPSALVGAPEKHKPPWIIYFFVVFGAVFLLGMVVTVIFCLRSSKVVAVGPWRTGLSGQLQKALVTGIAQLKRAEIELACEDFSNIVGTLRDGILYKGTLSSGVEIAVLSTSIASSKSGTKHSEELFRKKVETLSKVSHKNFVNLLGYCVEDVPFSRMMVFEYAPNGTLSEHLHVKEAGQLDWPTRLRIIMGIAYCLDYMHQQSPPIIHKNLNSDGIYLTDDYAAKVSDFEFPTSVSTVELEHGDQMNNIQSFGKLVLEILTGRPPYLEGVELVDWAFTCMKGSQSLGCMMDPDLTSFVEDVAAALFELARACILPDAGAMNSMGEVTSKLRELTGISPNDATPRLSPLWWAELEIAAETS